MSSGTSDDPAPLVLVVDDDDAVRMVAARALRREGYRVLEASGGDEAVRLLEETEERVDLLLTDVMMPGMGGRELSRRLEEARPSMRVLFMSAYTADEILLRGVRLAETRFIQKPFTLRSLAAAVREALEDPDSPGRGTGSTPPPGP